MAEYFYRGSHRMVTLGAGDFKFSNQNLEFIQKKIFAPSLLQSAVEQNPIRMKTSMTPLDLGLLGRLPLAPIYI